MEVEIEDMKTISIWVIVKRLPMELWNEDGLVMWPAPLIDKLIEEAKRTTYARICVDISADCEYSEAIPVVLDKHKAYLLPVEYN